MSHKKDIFTITFAILGLVIILFVLFPLGKMIFTSDPGVLYQTFIDKEVRDSIWLTLYASLLATIFAFIFGVPLAYLLARKEFWGKSIVEGLIDLPIIIPHIAAGIALLFVFGRRFFIGRAFSFLGISFVDEIAGVVIAMLFVSVPFLINSAKEGFKSVDPRLENVARTLGASSWESFWKVSFPLASRSILSGGIMMWARGISEFGAIVILAYHPMTASVLTFERFESYGLEYSRPVAVLLILICLSLFIILRMLASGGRRL